MTKTRIGLLILLALTLVYAPRLYFSWHHWGLSAKTLMQIATGHPHWAVRRVTVDGVSVGWSVNPDAVVLDVPPVLGATVEVTFVD